MAPRKSNVSVQTLVLQRLDETREDLKVLTGTVSTGFENVHKAMTTHVLEDTSKFATLDARVATVEGTRKTARWIVGLLAAALFTGLCDFLFDHLPRMLQP